MKRALFALTFVAAAACAAGAGAQQVTKDGQRIGTRDELRACYDTRDAIDVHQKEILERRKKLAGQADELKAEGDDLRTQVKQADDDNLTGLRRTRLERKVKEHDARLKELQAAAATLESDTNALEKQAEEHKQKCTNVAFANDDVAAVKKEREAAGKK
jgi:chromosome segregation ATPase